ncbi:MAG: XdhC family protein [Hyphomicrobiaceae bacterium]|nr:XdhC family protein [Hyphomicrobiaceae bacterium]
MDLVTLQRLNAARRARKAALVATDPSTGTQRLIEEESLDPADPLAAEFEARFRTGKSGMIEPADGPRLFLTVIVPPPRLVVIGAVHISQALAPMATACGFDVGIIDPRTAFATDERFAGIALYPEWPQDVIPARIGLDAYTAVAALTHDPKIDDFPLAEALRRGCFYVGALGSRKTHARRVERLAEAGLTPDQIARIAAPIGLDIGAQSPAEIAVSVIAEVIAALRKDRRRAKPGVAP